MSVAKQKSGTQTTRRTAENAVTTAKYKLATKGTKNTKKAEQDEGRAAPLFVNFVFFVTSRAWRDWEPKAQAAHLRRGLRPFAVACFSD